MKLKARKAFKYSTRRLLPGDEFEASNRDARLLIAIKKAFAVRAEVPVPPPPPAVAKQIEEAILPPASVEDLKAVRAEYEAALGKKPFPGWGVDALKEKIAAAKADQ